MRYENKYPRKGERVIKFVRLAIAFLRQTRQRKADDQGTTGSVMKGSNARLINGDREALVGPAAGWEGAGGRRGTLPRALASVSNIVVGPRDKVTLEERERQAEKFE
jgi:hypothetical protein